MLKISESLAPLFVTVSQIIREVNESHNMIKFTNTKKYWKQSHNETCSEILILYVNQIRVVKLILHAQSLSCVWLFVTPWTIVCRVSLSVEFPRQEYWSGLPFPSPGDLPDSGIKSVSPELAGRFFTVWATREAPLKLWNTK